MRGRDGYVRGEGTVRGDKGVYWKGWGVGGHAVGGARPDEIKLVRGAGWAAGRRRLSKAGEVLASDNSAKPVLTPTKNLVKGPSYAQLPALPRPAVRADAHSPTLSAQLSCCPPALYVPTQQRRLSPLPSFLPLLPLSSSSSSCLSRPPHARQSSASCLRSGHQTHHKIKIKRFNIITTFRSIRQFTRVFISWWLYEPLALLKVIMAGARRGKRGVRGS